MARRAVGCLKSYGMDQKLIRLIKAIYGETQLAVLVNGHLSEWFQMTVGNRQGNPLLPRSFALFLGRIMDKIKNREDSGVSVHGNRVNNLRFADDIDIIEQRMRNCRIYGSRLITLRK